MFSEEYKRTFNKLIIIYKRKQNYNLRRKKDENEPIFIRRTEGLHNI